jgi:hypothetical protein
MDGSFMTLCGGRAGGSSCSDRFDGTTGDAGPAEL